MSQLDDFGRFPDRTSISLSRKTFARLDCYNFWLRRNEGRNYPSYSALLDALLDEVLEADEKASAFVKRYSEAFRPFLFHPQVIPTWFCHSEAAGRRIYHAGLSPAFFVRRRRKSVLHTPILQPAPMDSNSHMVAFIYVGVDS